MAEQSWSTETRRRRRLQTAARGETEYFCRVRSRCSRVIQGMEWRHQVCLHGVRVSFDIVWIPATVIAGVERHAARVSPGVVDIIVVSFDIVYRDRANDADNTSPRARFARLNLDQFDGDTVSFDIVLLHRGERHGDIGYRHLNVISISGPYRLIAMLQLDLVADAVAQSEWRHCRRRRDAAASQNRPTVDGGDDALGPGIRTRYFRQSL